MHKSLNKKSIIIPLTVYWVALIVWQLFLPTNLTRTTIDIAAKVGLLLYLVVSFTFHANKFNGRNLLLLVLFLVSMTISFFNESLSANIIVYYLFVIVFLFLVFVLADKSIISAEDYTFFLKTVVAVGFISALYAVIFCSDQFLSAFRISSAYGNELMSFFDSSHVYGLYMSACFISCILLLEKAKKKNWYYLLMLLFLVNLIFTFSRTAIFSTIIFSLVYIFLGKNKKLKKSVIVVATLALVIYISSSNVRQFVETIVLKNGNVAGRDTLNDVTFKIFNESTFTEKLFGIGLSNTRYRLTILTTHESTHNAFTEILLCFGIIGLSWLVGVLLFSLIHCLKTVKYDKHNSINFLCLIAWCIGMMIPNTFVIFTSSVDCYFLTIFSIVVPRYYLNGIKQRTI